MLEAFKESDELTDDETSDDTEQQTMETSDDTQQTMETSDDTQQTTETCEDTCRQQTKEWFNKIYRGGLTRCTNDFYNFLRNVELEMKAMLQDNETRKQINTSKALQELKKQTMSINHGKI